MYDSRRRRSSYFFEGVEKRLEVWFSRKDGNTTNCDLRRISREDIESILHRANCHIISFTRNDFIDSYLLSESSMFVSKRWIVLKTCGQTTPLLCLQHLFHLVRQHTGFDQVEDLLYSRKYYKRPELQAESHRTFSQETSLLDSTGLNGTAYCLGAVINDCYYLYKLNSKMSIAGDNVVESNAGNQLADNSPFADREESLCIIMNDLDPEVMKIFTRQVSSTAEEATRMSGIDKILPNVKIDDYLFIPCGYSMNGLFDNGQYMVIHITPEPRFSYVSFECKTPQWRNMELITRVLNLFRPANFIVTAFAKKMSIGNKDAHAVLPSALCIGEFSRRQIQYLSFEDRDLIYALYSK